MRRITKSYSNVSMIIFGNSLYLVLIINLMQKLLSQLIFKRSDNIRYVEYDTSGYTFNTSCTLSNMVTLTVLRTH